MFYNGSLVWEFIGLKFRVNQLAVYCNFKTSTHRWFKLESIDLLFVFGKNFFCQTDSFRFVVSSTAVTQMDFHFLLLSFEKWHRIPCHVYKGWFYEDFFLVAFFLAVVFLVAFFFFPAPNALSKLLAYFGVEPTRRIVTVTLLRIFS